MEDPKKNNGDAAQTLTLGPTDKFIIIQVDDASQQIRTMAPNISDEIEVLQIITASLASLAAQIVAARKAEKSNLIKLPPGARLA